MATTLYEQTFHSGYRLGIEYSESSATSDSAISSNTTTLTVTIYLRSTGSSWTINSSAEKTVKLTVNGTTYTKTASGLANLNGNQKKTLLSKSISIKHNTDGTKSVSASGSFTVNATLSGDYVGTVTVSSHTITMARIPRPSTSTVSGTANVGSAVTINTNRAASDLTHTLQYSTDGKTFTNIATSVGASRSWTLPEAIAIAYPNAKSGAVTIRTITYLSGKAIGTKDTKITAYITESYAKPSITTVSTSQVNDAEIPLYVAGKSTVTMAITASILHGAKASYYTITIGGTSYRVNSTAGTLNYEFLVPPGISGTLNCTVKVTDSRGYVATAYAVALTITPYAAPVISDIEIIRGEIIDGDFVERNVGTYVRITFSGTISSVGDYNGKSYEAEYKLANGNYSELVAETDLDTYTPSSVVVIPQTQLDSDKTYKVRVNLIDSFGDSSEIITVRSQGILMNFGAEGRSCAIGGKATTPGKFQVFYNTMFQSGVTMIPVDNGTDLDDLKTPGWYYIESTYSLVNCPISSGSAALEILMMSETEITQVLRYPDSDDVIKDTSRYYDGSAWKAWKSQYDNLASYILDLVYPVGSLYWSSNSTNPGTLFGGTWTRITDKFILAAGSTYSANGSGGAATHRHLAPVGYNSNHVFGIVNINGTTSGGNGDHYETASAPNHGTLSSNVTMSYTGAGSSLPPYVVRYCWERTA